MIMIQLTAAQTLCGVEHLIENLLLQARKVIISVYFTQTALLQRPMRMSVSLEKVIHSSDLGLKLKTYAPVVI